MIHISSHTPVKLLSGHFSIPLRSQEDGSSIVPIFLAPGVRPQILRWLDEFRLGFCVMKWEDWTVDRVWDCAVKLYLEHCGGQWHLHSKVSLLGGSMFFRNTGSLCSTLGPFCVFLFLSICSWSPAASSYRHLYPKMPLLGAKSKGA